MADSDSFTFAQRIAPRLIKRGLLTEKDYERHMKALPDVAEKAAPVEATIETMTVHAAGQHPEEE